MNYFVVFFVLFSIIYNAQCQPFARVAGGSATEISKYPFATALLSSFGGTTYTQSCGGVILNSDTILSVASCFQTEQDEHPVIWWRARVGSSYANAGGTVHLVQQITKHPDFDYSTRVSDIAILKLTFVLTYSTNLISPAQIAGSGLELNTFQQVTAIGWGITTDNGQSSSDLRESEMWVVDSGTCGNRYSQIGNTVDDNMVCVGWLDVGVRGQCEGDNGSPILLDGVVVGLYSWSEGCANARYPGVNTKTAPYTSWIINTALGL